MQNFPTKDHERIELLVADLYRIRLELVHEFATHPEIIEHFSGEIADSIRTLEAVLFRLKMKEVA